VVAGIAVGVVVTAGSSIESGTGVGVDVDASIHTDNTRLTSKNTTNIHPVFRVLLWYSRYRTF
jgi:hypothetical protein